MLPTLHNYNQFNLFLQLQMIFLLFCLDKKFHEMAKVGNTDFMYLPHQEKNRMPLGEKAIP